MGIKNSKDACHKPGSGKDSTTRSDTRESSHDPALQQTVESCQKRIGSLATSGRYHVPPKHLDQDYVITKKELGSGYNGSVFMATRKGASSASSEQRFAVKAFKLRGIDKTKREELQQECEIFLQMDHPHVARLTDVYEEEDSLTLVMECMEGGELFDRIIEKKRFSEKDAANAAYQMTLALNYLHSHGIVHRDVKLENWLYEKKDTDHLKLIDFGFSKMWDEHTKMRNSCGTLSYVAPEVLRKSYTSKCDMWSLGVVVFILLAGYMPFSGPDESQIRHIKAGSFSWKPEKWKSVSSLAQEFVKKLMVVDPDARLSAEDALKHKWLTSNADAESNDNNGLNSQEVARDMYEFAQASKFRRTCMLAMAWSLSNEERSSLRQAFLDIDTSKHGTITLGDFKKVVEEKFHLSDEKIEELFNAIDAAHNHEIQYSEFLAAMVSSRVHLHDDLINAAFRRFDTDNSGYIDAANLKAVLVDSSDAEIEEMMNEVDANHDGKISHAEFLEYIRSSRSKEEHMTSIHSFIDKQKSLTNNNEDDGLKRTTSSKLAPKTNALVAKEP